MVTWHVTRAGPFYRMLIHIICADTCTIFSNIKIRQSILVLLHCYLIPMTTLSAKVELGILVIFYLVWNLLATSDKQHRMGIEFLACTILLLSKQNSFTNFTLVLCLWSDVYTLEIKHKNILKNKLCHLNFLIRNKQIIQPIFIWYD